MTPETKNEPLSDVLIARDLGKARLSWKPSTKAAAHISIAAAMLSLLFLTSKPSINGVPKALACAVTLSTLVYFGSRLFSRIEGAAARFANSRLSILGTFLAGVAIVSSISLLGRFPQPDAHDEFSNLLAADTFAHGRLTNPTHPMWEHFETFHVIQTPSYASKYPPAEGLILALGQVLGNPIYGVWLSAGLLCAALFWMLKQWLPPKWALIGVAIACFHTELLDWGHSFWPGQLAMVGGALALGAFRRALDDATAGDGLIAGIGVALMANTRPYEGLVLTILLAIALLVWTLTQANHLSPRALIRFGVPACTVLLLAALGMGYYNHRVTGHWLTLPYSVHEAQYDPVPLFLWQSMKPIPAYNHPEFYDLFVRLSIRPYAAGQTLSGFLHLSWAKATLYAEWYFRGFVVPLLILAAIPLVLSRDKFMRLAALLLALFFIGLTPSTWANGSHYFAPAASLCFLLPLMALRHLKVWRWKGLRTGLLLTRSLITAVLVFFVAIFVSGVHGLRAKQFLWQYQRADLLQTLEQHGGPQLVVVRYLPGHSTIQQWVYNDADIDGSKVVWAHDMGLEKNRELINYFSNRRTWLLAIGPDSARMVPYSEEVEAEIAAGPDTDDMDQRVR
ncbi:MAG TPA: hypothetical protein VI756_27210 [Blastocatellia bacterium]